MRTAVVFSPPRCGVSLVFASGMGGVTAPSCVSLGFANSMDPARAAVVVSPPRCVFPSRSQTVCVQRGRRWCSHRLCWPTAAVAGLIRGCAGSDDSGGVLAASLLPLVMDLGSGVGDGPVRTAVGLLPRRCFPWVCERCGSSAGGGGGLAASLWVSLAFANRMCPARTVVVLALPLLAYGCCDWACSRLCRQRRRLWGSRRVTFASRDGPGIRGG